MSKILAGNCKYIFLHESRFFGRNYRNKIIDSFLLIIEIILKDIKLYTIENNVPLKPGWTRSPKILRIVLTHTLCDICFCLEKKIIP